MGVGKFIESLGSEETLPSVEITVSVYHTSIDGSDPQEIITSSTVTIDHNTSDPYELAIGSGSEQTFTPADPRRLRAYIDVTAINGGGSFTLAYDSSADPSSLDTPSMVVPDYSLFLLAIVIFIPIVMNLFIKKRRLAMRLTSFGISLLAVLAILGQQVLPAVAAPDVFYLHDSDSSLVPLSAKTGNFTAIAGTGDQSVTGVGFNPKAVLFMLSDRTSAGSGSPAR